jgi:hypothetical protein
LHVFKALSRVTKAPAPEQLMPARRAYRRYHYGLQDMRTCRYSAAPTQLITHRCDCAGEVTRQDGTKPLTVCNVAARRDMAHFTPLRASFARLAITTIDVVYDSNHFRATCRALELNVTIRP